MPQVNLALGTMYFGTRLDERGSFELLDRFVAVGGTLVDTADCYSFWAHSSGFGGQSERIIGRWLAARPGARDRVSISTKVGAEPSDGGDWPANREGLSAPAIKTAVEGSLRRLGVERVDMLWAHMEDRSVALEETARGFAELVESGTAGRLGASNHAVWRVERARRVAEDHGWAGYTALQLRHSYLRPRPDSPVPDQNHRFGWVTEEVLDYVDTHPDMELWGYTTLLNGYYAREDRPLPQAYDHPGNALRMAALSQVAEELGVTRNQVVLAWLTGGTPAVTPVVGVSGVGQLEEALAGVALVLPEEHRRRLDQAG
ncbi:aldo/keto reductase [Sphaerisporangium sp. NPDC004334]